MARAGNFRLMWESFVRWFIHCFDVHCSDCIVDAEDKKRCVNCETYLNLLEIERAEKKHLLNYVLNTNHNTELNYESNKIEEDIKPIHRGNKPVPWPQLRRQLEVEDRKKFREAADKGVDKTIETLEKELGIEDA